MKRKPTIASQIEQLQKTVKLTAAATLKLARKVDKLERQARKEAARVITGFSDARGDMIPMEEDEE
mgnify:CR=1 FL=1